MSGEMTNAYMICTDGYSRVFCLVDDFLCELERICEEYPEDDEEE
jgi:hypothetical protein